MDVYRNCEYKFFGVEVNPDFSTVRIGKFESNVSRRDFVGIYYTHLERDSNFLYRIIPTHSLPVNNKNFALFVSPEVVQIKDVLQHDVHVTLTQSKHYERLIDYGLSCDNSDVASEHEDKEAQSRYPEEDEEDLNLISLKSDSISNSSHEATGTGTLSCP